MARRVFASLALLAACGGALAQADGAALFAAHCQACHQPGAVGAPGIAPPLVGNIGRHAANEEGRRYLMRVALTGMIGSITVDGVRYTGNMPSFAVALSDAELAAVLRHVLAGYEKVADLAWLTPEQLAATRQAGGSPNETHKMRGRLPAGG
ncbi:cytochrome c [uncultured Dechloromonas sp.]|uniref:c-type cytochrome n=1 Tax=uncultured Dechloromonas sp. TaxID=171719 RepID=UPI0025FDB920|nr:cytochrome c [uncultured Dechloromonas sp.]